MNATDLHVESAALVSSLFIVMGKKKKIHVRSPAANFVVIRILKFVSPAATNNKQYPKVMNNENFKQLLAYVVDFDMKLQGYE